MRLTAHESSAVGGESQLVLGLYRVRSEAGRRHMPHEQNRLDDAVSAVLQSHANGSVTIAT